MSTPTLPQAAARPIRPFPIEETAGRQRAEPSASRTRALVCLGIAVVLIGFAARCFDVARSDAITSDEATYLTHSLHFWMTGDDLAMWELGTPRLPHVLNAWPSFVALRQAELLPAVAYPKAIEELVLSGARRVLLPARCMAILWGIGLLAAVFWGVARTRGAVAGLIAAGLLSLVPEVVAHSAIAGSDMPFATAALLSIIVLTRYVERPSRWRWVAAGLAIGLSWAMRHSALILLILGVGVHLWLSVLRVRPDGSTDDQPSPGTPMERLLGSLRACVGLGLVAYLVLWAGDGFGVITVADIAEKAATVTVPERIGPVEVARWPVPSSFVSVLKQVRHQNKGHEAYLCGSYSEQGWTLYFPIAFLLKTPVGLLALMILAAARLRPKGAWEAVCLACLALLWIMLVRNKVNIGVRYGLLTYPLVIPFVARLFEPSALADRAWRPLVIGAAVWFGVAALWCHPRYLSYFNEIGGGPSRAWLYLADSNIDWGQDFDRLTPALKRLRIEEVTTDVTSERRLSAPGLAAYRNPSRSMYVPAVTPPNRRLYDADGGYLPVYTRYVAVSVSRLLGLYSQNDMSWLRSRRLVGRVGDSIFVFDMDLPAERPFLGD